MRRRNSFALALAVVLASAVLASMVLPALAWAAPTYPEARGNVNDFAGVLTDTDKTNLDALVQSLLDQTGAVFAVAVIDSLEGESSEVYAVKLFEKWGIGEKDKDNGLLLLIALEERETRMEVGYGLEGVITDRRAGESLDKMIPYLQEGEYGKGIYAALLNAAEYVAKDAGVTLEIKPATKEYEQVVEDMGPFPWGLLAWLIGVPCLVTMYLVMRGNRCPRCKSRLVVTDRVVQGATYDAGGLAMKILHCPKCGYHNEKPYRTARLIRPGTGGMPPVRPGPFGGIGGSGRGGGFSGPRGFGGGSSGGGGAGRKW